MNYNLQKTDRCEKETLDHLLTVLFTMSEEIRMYEEVKKQKLAKKEWVRARKYLKGYIWELFKQKKLI